MFRINTPPLLHRDSQRKCNNSLHSTHRLGSDCFDRFLSTGKKSHHSIHPLAIAVFAACSLAITAPNVIDPVFAADVDWDGSDPSVLEIVTPDLGDIHTVNKNLYDWDTVNHNWLWTVQGDDKNPELNILVKEIVEGTKNESDGKFSDRSGTNALWIAASLKTILTSSQYIYQDYQNLAEATAAGSDYSSTTCNSSVTLNFAEDAAILAKVYGARNDLGGGTAVDNYDKDAGKANDNSVTVNMADGSRFYAKLVFGGRSAQMDRIQDLVHAGFETDRNLVQINGTIDEGTARTLESNDKSLGLVITKGIFGAEGYQANNNRVNLNNVAVVAGMAGARKLGLVGGRGLYYLRINSDNDGTYKEVVHGSDEFYVGDRAGQRVSAIANNNVVTIKNSYLGYYVDAETNDMSWSWAPYPNEESREVGFTVYGGWSTGVASDNIVAAEDSVINGNVIGGLEFQDQLKVQEENGVLQLRDLHANLVSLKDTTIKAGSIYGSTTAEGDLYENNVSYDNTNSLNEGTTRAVNRYRGAVYIAGEVSADATYARYVTFGQYVDTEKLRGNYTVALSYYPSTDPSTEDSDRQKALEDATERLGFGAKGSIYLGQQVAGSYLINRDGFHSSLTATDPYENGTGSQSTKTDGYDNFWAGVYVNLVGKVDGTGKSLNTAVNLFDSDNKVLNEYSQGGLALAALDDGYVFSSDKDTPWMQQFRDKYTNETGRVLYLAVNDGSNGGNDVRAVDINLFGIDSFRNDVTNQGTNAFGNTQVGVWVNGNGVVDEEGNVSPYTNPPKDQGETSTVWDSFVIHAPGFEIIQTAENSPEAYATFGIYKYLHFDGEYDLETGIKQTAEGEAGGVGLKYWLESLNLQEGKSLVLYGKGLDETVENAETYTLSAYLTGAGGITIPENNVVIVGNTNQPDLATVISGDGGVAQETVGENTFTGSTIIGQSAQLIQGSNGALGSKTLYTSELSLESGTEENLTAYKLRGHTQTVGGLAVNENAVIYFNDKASSGDSTESSAAAANADDAGELTVKGDAKVRGSLIDSENQSDVEVSSAIPTLIMDSGKLDIYSDNAGFTGLVDLKTSNAQLFSTNALVNATARVGTDSSLYFDIQKNTTAQASALRTAENAVVENHYNTVAIRGIENYGSVYLSHKIFGDNLGREATRSDVSLNKVNVGNYKGGEGSILYYQGFLGGPVGSENSSYVDVVYADTASGQSTVYFINEDGKFGAFSQSRGETVGEGGTNGILIFEVKDPNEHVDLAFPDGQTRIGVVAKDNETHVKFYRLNEQGDGNDWYLVNKADGDVAIPWTPIEPPEEPEVPVVPPEDPEQPEMPDNPTSPTPDDEGNTLRPEGGAYMANSQAWAKMHMRLHDRFGQAYYIDPFDGKEKPAAAWVRQVGSHSHFKSGSGESRTHARTAVTQIGADLIRNEINEDWKYIGGVFAGGLYHRANTRTYASAKSRSDGYAVGIYGTLYTGNSPDDGFYVDSWLLYGRYDNKLWGETTSTFNYKSHGWVWSVESGYTIPLGESGTKDFNKVIWTFQPEVQVVWDGVKANDGYDATDTKYKQLGKDNVAIRVGARVHGNYMNKGLGFIEGNWIHNTKKTGVQMGSAKTYMDGGRDLGEFRMGLEGHITRNTLGWATVGVQAGKAGYHNETAQIGIKYMF